MIWANFLHLYQPAEQQEDILEAIVTQSYRPLLEGLRDRPKARLTLNVNSALLELFDRYGYRDLIDLLRQLGESGRVEFTASAKYHALLPFLDRDETIRQITINNETSQYFLGPAYQPRGIFPPEMAYREELGLLFAELGYQWVILDEIACGGVPGQVDYDTVYRVRGTSLSVFFRDRRMSNLIMSAVVRSGASLQESIGTPAPGERYLLTAMDGETFGHHRPGLERLLFDILDAPQFQLIQVSDITRHIQKTAEIVPTKSTWASSAEDIQKNIQFLSWSDPENPIHTAQWELSHLTLAEVHAMPHEHPAYAAVRKKMDIGLASDHFWWASAKPWWSMEMIEDGCYRLLDTLRSIPDVTPEKLRRAQDLYEQIVSTAFSWQRSGRIRKMMREQQSALRIPFRDRTLGKGGAEQGVYHAFMDLMQQQEHRAIERREYEKAILWRDAMYKLEHKHDIYDTVNAIDLLRLELPNDEIERTIEKYKAQYRAIRGGQPEQRGH